MPVKKGNNVTWNVLGMHCASCVELVNQELSSLPGVEGVSVSLSKGQAVLTLFPGSPEPSKEAADNKLKPYGFSIGRVDSLQDLPAKDAGSAGGPLIWIKSFLAAGIVIALFLVLQNSGLISFSGFLSGSGGSGSPFLALIMGFAASVSSCLAIVGSIVISFSMLYRNDSGKTGMGTVLKPNLVFQAGRIAGFALLGGILGLAGGSLSISGPVLATVQIILVLFLLAAALTILGAGPLLGRFGLKVPAPVSRLMIKLKTSQSPAAPLLLGGLTFFIPCGFTQSMQITALGSGSFLSGGLIMLAFSLGTVPVLLAAGLTAGWPRRKGAAVVQKAAGLLIVFFAATTFFTALPLFSYTGNLFAGETAGESKITASQPPETGDFQNIEMHVTAGGFEPHTLEVKKGIPVNWTIWGDEITGCTNAIIIPAMKAKINLKDGANTIRFTAMETGTINYSCWMGMVRAVIRVVD